MTLPKENSGKKKSKATKIFVLILPSIMFGTIGAIIYSYPPDLHRESWEIILFVIGLSGIATFFLWAKIEEEESEKGKKRPKSDVEREQQEQKETLPSDNNESKTPYVGLSLLVLFFSIILLFSIIPPMICNEVKTDFEVNPQMASIKHGFNSFEEWNDSSMFTLDSNCWWEVPFGGLIGGR